MTPNTCVDVEDKGAGESCEESPLKNTSRTNAKGNVLTRTYDAIGRVLTETHSRRMLLGVTLCATLVASVWANRQEDAEVQLADTVRTSFADATRKLPASIEPVVDSPMLELDKLEHAKMAFFLMIQ